MSITRPVNNSIPFANLSAQINTIPNTQATSGDGHASWTGGFPAETMLPPTSGGIPPDGKDFNGVINFLSNHQVFLNAGGRYRFDAGLSTANGGYPIGFVLQTDNGASEYVSTIANNTNNPNSVLTGWKPYAGEALETEINAVITAETARATAAETTLQTNITNEANTRATADTTLQTNINTETTRATAAEGNLQTQINGLIDFFLPVGSIVEYSTNIDPNVKYAGTTWVRRGEGKAVVGLSVQSGDPAWTKTLGTTFGEYDHTLIIPEMPSHTHGHSGNGTPNNVAWSNSAGDPTPGTGTSDATGGGGSHNNVQPSIVDARWERTA